MPSDRIVDDPSWQALHAFRWICECFLGYPEPQSPGATLQLEVRQLTAEESEEWRRLSPREQQARLRESVMQMERDRLGLSPQGSSE
jgi:hypothetical protein